MYFWTTQSLTWQLLKMYSWMSLRFCIIAMPRPLFNDAGFTSHMFFVQCLAGRLSVTKLPRAISLNFDWSRINSFRPVLFALPDVLAMTKVVGVESNTV